MTSKEHILQNQHSAYKLKQLYEKDIDSFFQIADYIPYCIYTNKQKNLNINYANNTFLSKGEELIALKENGSQYLDKVCNKFLLEYGRKKVDIFSKIKDNDRNCNFLMEMSMNSVPKLMSTNKYFLNDNLYLNVSFDVQEMDGVGKIITKLFEPLKNSLYKWEQFQSLTKQEKIIVKKIAASYSSKEIANDLFISVHTVNTHKKNIFYKLDIKKSNEVIKFAQLLEIL